MKIIDTLRKLGILRFGFKASTYTNAADRPYEFMSDDVFNAEKETVNFSKKNKCPQCGFQLRPDSAFCSNCGEKISSSAPPPLQNKEKPTTTPPSPKEHLSSQKHEPPARKSHKGLGCLLIIVLSIGSLIALVAWTMHQESERIRTTIEDTYTCSTDQAQIPSTPDGIEFNLYENTQLGFSTEFPDSWNSQSIRGSMVFSGQEGTDQERTTINIQAVARTDANTLQTEAESILTQLSESESFLSEGTAVEKFHGSDAAYMLVSYNIGENKFRQLQIIAQMEQFYLFIGYTAPADLFDKYLYSLHHCTYSFKNIPIVTEPIEEEKTTATESSENNPAKRGGLEELGKSLEDALNQFLNDLGGTK